MSRRKARVAAVPRAALAVVHPGDVSAVFWFCSVRAYTHELGVNRLPFMILDQRCASGQLVEARNDVVADFLKLDLEWLWCVDSDMGFEADTLDRLLASADPVDRPVVGALCFGLKKAGEDYDLRSIDLVCFPTVYAWQDTADDVGFQVMTNYERDALVKVSASGAACFVVHRSVLEKIRDKYGPVWFDKVTHPTGRTFSEDLSFFIRVAGVDVPAFVDTAIKTTHDKGGVHLTESKWDDQEALRVLRAS